MRFAKLLFATVLLAGAAHAQVVSPLGGPTSNPASAPPAGSSPAGDSGAHRATHRTRRTLAERFEAANTSHDGKLTLDQAKAGRMNAVARDFAQIDKEKRGYVTLDDIRTFQHDRREARRAARASKQPAQ